MKFKNLRHFLPSSKVIDHWPLALLLTHPWKRIFSQWHRGKIFFPSEGQRSAENESASRSEVKPRSFLSVRGLCRHSVISDVSWRIPSAAVVVCWWQDLSATTFVTPHDILRSCIRSRPSLSILRVTFTICCYVWTRARRLVSVHMCWITEGKEAGDWNWEKEPLSGMPLIHLHGPSPPRTCPLLPPSVSLPSDYSARRGLLCKCSGEWEPAAGFRADYVKLLVSLKTRCSQWMGISRCAAAAHRSFLKICFIRWQPFTSHI